MDISKKITSHQNLTDEDINEISKDSFYIVLYAKRLSRIGQTISDEFIDILCKDECDAYNYAVLVLKWKNVPQKIIDSLQRFGYNIPENVTIASTYFPTT